MNWKLSGFAVLALALGAAAQAPARKVRFVQITDAHIFDDGWKLPVADAMRQAADDRDALTWAAGEVNAMIGRGEQVDFVVYSGDFGLQNVDFAGSGCHAAETKLEPGLPPFELRAAVDEVARLIEGLRVPRVYFTPGNNDLAEEKVDDAGRFDCFVAALTTRLTVDKSEAKAVVLGPGSGFVAGGVRFLALDTAMFKRRANYEAFCANTVVAGGDPAAIEELRSACPARQLQALDHAVKTSAEPVALFVHVPDLNDPYRKASSWELPPELRAAWKADACSRNVIGVFAGHFHDANRAFYGVPSHELQVDACVADKTFVTPPLAAKNQTTAKPQARGLMTVEIDDAKVVTAGVTWYPGRP